VPLENPEPNQAPLPIFRMSFEQTVKDGSRFIGINLIQEIGLVLL
jgi:hypothetical protein